MSRNPRYKVIQKVGKFRKTIGFAGSKKSAKRYIKSKTPKFIIKRIRFKK